jgi:hypothetical protein
LVTRDDSEVESEESGNVKRHVGLFEDKEDVDYCLGCCIRVLNRVCIKWPDNSGFGAHKMKNIELEIGLM